MQHLPQWQHPTAAKTAAAVWTEAEAAGRLRRQGFSWLRLAAAQAAHVWSRLQGLLSVQAAHVWYRDCRASPVPPPPASPDAKQFRAAVVGAPQAAVPLQAGENTHAGKVGATTRAFGRHCDLCCSRSDHWCAPATAPCPGPVNASPKLSRRPAPASLPARLLPAMHNLSVPTPCPGLCLARRPVLPTPPAAPGAGWPGWRRAFPHC